MKILKTILTVFILFSTTELYAQQSFTGSDGITVTVDDFSRIVSIGSEVSETIFALTAGDAVVAVDESSVYPEEANNLPKVSYTRTLAAEGILSMSPSLILATDVAGPQTTIDQIRSAGVPLLMLTSEETVEGAYKRVEQLGRILDREQEADDIITNIQQTLAKVESIRNSLSEKPKVMFIYARGRNTLMVAGSGTSAKTVIELAGGENAFNELEDYKPLTAEAVIAANPDVILMMNSGLQSIGSKEGLLDLPGIRLTNAAKNNRIYSMNGNYLLGFGPRMGDAVIDLMYLLHPGLETSLAE